MFESGCEVALDFFYITKYTLYRKKIIIFAALQN